MEPHWPPLPVHPDTGQYHGHCSSRLLVQTGKGGGTEHPRFVACLQRPTAGTRGDVLMQWPWFTTKFLSQWERGGPRSELPGEVWGRSCPGPAGSQWPDVPVFWKHSCPFCAWDFVGVFLFFLDVVSLLNIPELPRLSETRQFKGINPVLCDVKIL